MSKGFPVLISFTGLTNFLGVVGVIGSLIFVGLELRQSQKIALGNQIQERANMAADFILTNLQGSGAGRQLLAIRKEGLNLNLVDPDTLNDEQYEAFNLIQDWRVNSIENVFQQYALGLLPDDVWSQVESRMMSHYSNCKLRHYYNSVIPALKKYVTTLPQDCSELITLDDWSASE